MENKNVFEETVATLIEDAKKLQAKFSKCQENNNFTEALSCMRLLKDTLSLIKEYDWELKYSEYETDGHKEVSIWEQNHCNEVRNHKKWIVHEDNRIMYIDFHDKNKALVFINGERYSLDYYPLAKNGRIPLIDFIRAYSSGYTIYVDKRGFGVAITDVLDTYDISYKEIKCNNFMQNYYNEQYFETALSFGNLICI